MQSSMKSMESELAKLRQMNAQLAREEAELDRMFEIVKGVLSTY